jgi:hypothetical protein
MLRGRGRRKSLRPVLVVNPRTDSLFVEYVRKQIDDLPDAEPHVLEQRLRKHHPAATVHARVLAGEPTTVWYVYRDGRWIPSE